MAWLKEQVSTYNRGNGYFKNTLGSASRFSWGDHDPNQAEATRRRVYDMLVAEKMLVQGIHYPFPALAHVEKAATGYREIPVVWNPTI